MKTAKQWIDELNLKPHFEGGYFVQTDYSDTPFLKNGREFPLYMNIYFLLTPDSRPIFINSLRMKCGFNMLGSHELFNH